MVGPHALHRRDRNLGAHGDLVSGHRRAHEPHLASSPIRLSRRADRGRSVSPAGVFRWDAGHGVSAIRAPLWDRGAARGVRSVSGHAGLGRFRPGVRHRHPARNHHAMESHHRHSRDRDRHGDLHLGRRSAGGRVGRRDPTRRLSPGRDRDARRRDASRGRRRRVRARLGRGQARRARLHTFLHDSLHVLGWPGGRRVDRRRIAWDRPPHRSTLARGTGAQGRTAGAHRIRRLRDPADRTLLAGGHQPLAGWRGRSQDARRRNLSDVRGHEAASGACGARGRGDSGGRHEQPRVRGQFARLGVHPRFLRADHQAPGPDTPPVGGPLAHAVLDRSIGRGRNGFQGSEHPGGPARAQHHIVDLGESAGDLRAGRPVAARPRA